tara:strand:- start:375 stop:485 length:111 start_codon:yes stop_codon:yes gene_type:complete
MIKGKENLDIRYWGRQIPSNLEITLLGAKTNTGVFY